MGVEPAKPGIRQCIKCCWLFVSPDKLRVARCRDCKQGENAYSPRTASTEQLHGAIRHLMKDIP